MPLDQISPVVPERASRASAPLTARPAAPRFSDAALVALLILIVVACYANILTNGFVYDDDQQILQNPYVRSWRFVPEIFGTNVWSFVGQAGSTNYYRPLMTFTFLLLWKLFGPIPYGFHLFSIAMHAAVVVMVFLLGSRLFQDRRVGWLAALFFAVHPVHTEAVAWIASVPDLQVTFLFLLAVWLFSTSQGFDWKRQFLVLACFSVALLAKEPAFMLVPVLVVFEHCLSPDRDTTTFLQKLYRYLPLCCAGLVYLILRASLFGKLAPVLQHATVTWTMALYSAFALIAAYARLLLFPFPLSAFHVFHSSDALFQAPVLAGIFIVALCLFGIFSLRRKVPQVSFSIVWMGLTLAPVLNARWMAANVLTERYLYLPSVGFCWLLAFALVKGSEAFPASLRKLTAAALILVTIVLSVLGGVDTLLRNRDWRDNLTLYSRTLQTDPDAWVMHMNLGTTYHAQGDLQNAKAEYQIALSQKPDSVNVLNALGLVSMDQKDPYTAESMFKRAIAIKPLWADPHYNYGRLLAQAGRKPAAYREFETAIEVAPLNPRAHLWYGQALSDDRQFRQAEIELKKSVELQSSPDSLKALARVYILTGQNQLAESTLRTILAGSPFDGESHLELAKILEKLGQRVEAANHYQSVLATDPGNSEAKFGLSRLRNP